MCWEQSPLQRTIATSRGDDNRDDSKKQERRLRKIHSSGPKNQATTQSATVAQKPGGKPLQLDKLFQERSHRPRGVGPERALSATSGAVAASHSSSASSPSPTWLSRSRRCGQRTPTTALTGTMR